MVDLYWNVMVDIMERYGRFILEQYEKLILERDGRFIGTMW